MAFIRQKQVKGNPYFYLVETLKNKKQRHIRYLGKSVPENMAGLWHKNRGKSLI